MSAGWTAATLLLIVLGFYDLVTGARTLGQSLFVRPSFSDRDRARGRVPEDGAIMDTDFERLRRRS